MMRFKPEAIAAARAGETVLYVCASRSVARRLAAQIVDLGAKPDGLTKVSFGDGSIEFVAMSDIPGGLQISALVIDEVLEP